jgi:hypothetical protein
MLAGPDQDGKFRIELNSYAFGKGYTVTITQAMLDKAPVWKETEENG